MALKRGCIFNGETPKGVSALCDDLHSWPASFVRRPSQSERRVYLKNGLTEFHQILYDHPFISTHSTATSDITSPSTSGQHLPKFEKTAESVASDGFAPNFSGAEF